jgi:TrmH family RNA methyltransferase
LITSPQNPRVKNAIKLRDARQRYRQGRMIIDGARELLRALRAGVEFIEVFVCDELCTSIECRQLLAALAKPVAHEGPPAIIHVSAAVFAKIAYGARAEGVVGVAKTPAASLADLTLPQNPLVAVLEGLEKPGNVGAVLRSADAAGVSALIVCDAGTDLFNPNTIRASLGTIFTVPTCAASADETLMWLRQRRLAIFTATSDAPTEYTNVDLAQPCAIVLGSEATGLSDNWRPDALSRKPPAPPGNKALLGATGLPSSGSPAEVITPIRLPMLGVADSLNVSAAAAVLFYEALRQRRPSAER